MQPLYIPEDAVPPERVRLEELRVEPWPDSRRVKVHAVVTPFTTPPNLKVVVTAPDGEEVTSTNIIETIQHRMVFTMHLLNTQLSGPFTLSAEVYYPDLNTVDQRSVTFDITLPDG